jgi:hypothetical protein
MDTLSDQPLQGEVAGVLAASASAPEGISAGTTEEAL